MALPPGFLDELRARVPISQIVGRRVQWDRRKSNPTRGDLWACCPFHQESTPSFHVEDRKGFYHCFGCGAKGDAISFLREQENMSFMEAVSELAREAGMAMPEADPAAAARAAKARGLADWMEQAVAFYRQHLAGPGGAGARAYIDRRGLSPATVAAFELGAAPAERQALLRHLTGLGAPVSALAEAGLVGVPEDGGQPYDRFRDRLMFPIRDPRGRCVGFGARALREGQEPKYLNSPETPLFDKSRTLFNLGRARAAAGRAGTVLVVEGYMDVIALCQAGFEHAVAPLGTALTEPQLHAIWRLSSLPILAFDGDKAGQRAALRAIDLALPNMSPSQALRIALLPDGQDPDDLIKSGGRAAVEAVLAAAESPAALMWRREVEDRDLDTPEGRAALDAALRAVLGRIKDGDLRRHYRASFGEQRAALLGAGREARRRAGDATRGPRVNGGTRGWIAPVAAMPGTRRSSLASRETDLTRLSREREAAVLLAILSHPPLLEAHADAIAEASFTQADLAGLRDTVLAIWSGKTDGAAALQAWRAGPGADALALLRGTTHVGRIVYGAKALDAETVERALVDDLGHLSLIETKLRETAEAERALGAAGEVAPVLDGRLRETARSAERLLEGTNEERTDDDASLAAALHDAISREIWVKKRR
jgi:DNA primase